MIQSCHCLYFKGQLRSFTVKAAFFASTGEAQVLALTKLGMLMFIRVRGDSGMAMRNGEGFRFKPCLQVRFFYRNDILRQFAFAAHYKCCTTRNFFGTKDSFGIYFINVNRLG